MIDYRSALERHGFQTDEAIRRATLFETAEAAFAALGTAAPPGARYHVPGRVEVLGKHTDYAGGRSLVCATEQGMALVAAPRADGVIRLVDARLSAHRELSIRPDLEPVQGEWLNYPTTVAARLAADFGPDLLGVDLAFASDIPVAAGVSSSSALVVGVALAVIDRNQLAAHERYRANVPSNEMLAAYLGAVENGRPFAGFDGGTGVGTLGGNQDHAAILCSRPDALTQVRFDPVRVEAVVAWPADLELVIAASGVTAEKTGAALDRYNDLARLTGRLETLIAGPTGETLGRALLDAPDGQGLVNRAWHRLESVPPGPDADRLKNRIAQLVAECRMIIPGVVGALERRDYLTLGDLVEASYQAADFALGNQIPETRFLVDLARRLGAIAALPFGAGWGGSVWAMVLRGLTRDFIDQWGEQYRARFPDRRDARFFRTRPAPAAIRLST